MADGRAPKLKLAEITEAESYDAPTAKRLWEQVKAVVNPTVSNLDTDEAFGQTVSALIALIAVCPDPLAIANLAFMVGLAVGQGAIVVEGHEFPDFTKEV